MEDERPIHPAEKEQRSNKGPAFLLRLLGRYDDSE
jgi:hypothetical protein